MCPSRLKLAPESCHEAKAPLSGLACRVHNVLVLDSASDEFCLMLSRQRLLKCTANVCMGVPGICSLLWLCKDLRGCCRTRL